MTHNEKRTLWWKEGLFGALAGLQYGLVQVSVGHPFDTLKTKMQVQEEFKRLRFTESVKKIYNSEGVRGFYKGGLSIVLGSSLFRSMQFLGFEAVHSRFDKDNLKGNSHSYYEKIFTYEIPHTKGLEVRTIAAGFASGILRSVIECPFEFVKVRKQIRTQFKFVNVYHGLFPLMLKNCLFISVGFSIIDSLRRNTKAWKSSLGIFVATGFSTIVCHVVFWPAEIFRNYYMSKNKAEIDKSINSLIRENIKTHGFMKGVFRGALPGLMSTFIRNGLAMVILQKFQKMVTQLGLRG